MEKRISTKQLAAAKYIARTVSSNLAKRDKAKQEIEKWTREFNHQENVIIGYETGLIRDIGLRSEQIVKRVIEPTGKFDKNGRELKQTKYVINDNVRFDSDTKEYIVTIPDEGDNEAAPIENENHIETASCDCEEQALQEADELEEIVNVTTGAVEVQQEEQNETAQPEAELQEAFDEDMFKY